MMKKQVEVKFIFYLLAIFFLLFLVYPILSLLGKSFIDESGFTFIQYTDMFANAEFLTALGNSFSVSICASICSVVLAFILAYTINYTNTKQWIKNAISIIAGIPMILPTITYGFAIIYSFGKQGLLTQLVGFQFFNVYGFYGILLGYVIYTLPIAFILINNAMKQIDKKYITVSRLMKDSFWRQFKMTLLRPLMGTFAASFIQCFFLSFTDFGIPASVGGKYHVLASLLYSYMLGSIPDFAKGAVIAMMMLIPSIISICLMQYLQKYNIVYTQISQTVLKKNRIRDSIWTMISACICFCVLSIFAVIFILPFVEQWPYQMNFTCKHFIHVLQDQQFLQVLKNTLWMATLTALLGTLAAYGGALITERSKLSTWMKKSVDSIVLVTNTIPGMVFGIAYLFIFSGTPFQNTLFLLVMCNIVHFFSTPYLMMKETLSKMNTSFEMTASLMGDSCLKTIVRIITPNAKSSLYEVFSYYFINATVTVSAIIFIAGAKTMVITTKIKELQYFAKFDQVFVLSLLLFAINLIVKYICSRAARKGI